MDMVMSVQFASMGGGGGGGGVKKGVIGGGCKKTIDMKEAARLTHCRSILCR